MRNWLLCLEFTKKEKSLKNYKWYWTEKRKKGDLNKMETVLIILGIYGTIMVYCAMRANWEIYRMMYPSDNNKKESEK